jgi:hypothetical protein
MECKLCGSAEFRLSRLRIVDISELIFFRYPVRCRICYKREFVNFFTALSIRHQSKLRREEEMRQRAAIARPLS